MIPRLSLLQWVVAGIICFSIAGISSAAASLFAARGSDSGLDPASVLGVRVITVYAVIQGVDAENRTIDLLVSSPAAEQSIPMRVHIAREFYVERRDAIIENGVMVGSTATKRGILDDLDPGVRGIALLHLAEDEVLRIQYILIGDPFPRP